MLDMNMYIYATVTHHLPAWIPEVLSHFCWFPSMLLRMIIWFSKVKARICEHTATFSLRLEETGLLPLSIFYCSFFPFPSSSAHNTYFSTPAAFDAPLRSKFKEVLAVSHKTWRKLQKEMVINHPLPYEVYFFYGEQTCHCFGVSEHYVLILCVYDSCLTHTCSSFTALQGLNSFTCASVFTNTLGN